MSMIFPVTKSCHKIISHVYTCNGIKISKLLRETSVSQRIGYKHVDKLIESHVFKEEQTGSLRIIKPNINSETGRLMFGLIEKQRELKLIDKKPELKESLDNLKMNAHQLSIQSVILFGAFVKNGDKEKINILVICENNDKRILPFLQQCFNNLENAVIARILSPKGFEKFKNTKQDLYQELFRNHVCVYNTQRFLELIA